MNRRNVTIFSVVALVLTVITYILALNDIALLSLAAFALGIFLVAWVMAIIMTVRNRQWIWLVVVVVLGVIGTLLYGIFGKERQGA